ncbi:hypothetical protein [Leuconostoc fallax]|nr:hypothetical protein [Leuconostoc fallax]
MKFIHAGDVHLGNPFSGLDQQLPYELKNKYKMPQLRLLQP